VIDQKKQWLLGATWDSIVNVNRTLCQNQKVEPSVNMRNHDAAQRAWEQLRENPTTLLEAIDACHRTFNKSPFTFNNGNTFAAIARSLVDDHLRAAPALEAQILRSTIGHYVAGTIDRKELASVLGQLAPVLGRSAATPARPAAGAAAGEIAPAHMAQPRPVATS